MSISIACSLGLCHKVTKAILKDLNGIFENVCHDFGASLAEFNGEQDHVHLLVNYPPKAPILKLVNSLKGVSSRLLRKKQYPSVLKALWGNSLWSRLWSPSYFASSCGGAPLGILTQYIQDQKTPK